MSNSFCTSISVGASFFLDKSKMIFNFFGIHSSVLQTIKFSMICICLCLSSFGIVTSIDEPKCPLIFLLLQSFGKIIDQVCGASELNLIPSVNFGSNDIFKRASSLLISIGNSNNFSVVISQDSGNVNDNIDIVLSFLLIILIQWLFVSAITRSPEVGSIVKPLGSLNVKSFVGLPAPNTVVHLPSGSTHLIFPLYVSAT